LPINTPYKALEFAKNDVITKDDVDQMQTNLQYIKDNTPRGRFIGPRKIHNSLNVLIAGRTPIRKNTKSRSAYVKVEFPARAFDPGCRPAITTGIVSDQTSKIFCVVNGPGGTDYPTATGFDISVVVSKDSAQNSIIRDFWVDWHAYGYRTDNWGFA
jgi:hypothetical protein